MLVDPSVSWDADWPVVLKGSRGAVMMVLVAGSFLAIADRAASLGAAAPRLQPGQLRGEVVEAERAL